MSDTPVGYSVAPVPTAIIETVGAPASSTASIISTTSTSSSHTLSVSRSSTTASEVPEVTTSTSTTTSSTSDSPSTSSTGAFTFLQLSGEKVLSYNPEQVAEASFDTLCPSGNCYDSCSNFSLLLDKDSYTFSATSNVNISSVADGISLFGICSNIANVTKAVSLGEISTAESFFPAADAGAEDQGITLNTTLCLFDTCQATRDPEQYVFGIGVLISYIMQAILVIICAAGVLASSALQLVKHPKGQVSMPESWKDGLGTFLAAQCYFGVSSVVASFSMGPLSINPLDGYALLSVAITAFMPPVFTLMLLHHKGKKSWFSTALVLVSWLTASILFFMLLSNLWSVSNNPKRLAEARNSLFQVDSCGGYSAMSLCQENMHNDPLKYLTLFYNKQSLPNIQTVILLWLWTTIVLAILQFRQFSAGGKTQSAGQGPHPTTRARSWKARLAAIFNNLNNATTHLIVVLIASIIFGLAFGYQARMVIQYFEMDVVDKYGWSFGQWVAVLFWIPPLIDFVRRLLSKDQKSSSTSTSTAAAGTTKSISVKRKPPSSNSSYQPLAHSPMPSQDPFDTSSPFEPLRQPTQPQPVGDEFELRRIRRQTTTGLEAGT
ncbi:hypothetical protein LTR70_003107 [Exophiala xenobiotica]|uniref:Uncharacterized protein n=1 Tax=Lithohypha guttulata TaxID=1690604 RepID=A0ABR0KHF8_9EURO|nr:hypothetical protein LTR24_002660 [Lithohypha guttulata]KAK5323818.1 hypothetical protein LTR70_003107 [Exophiala xenobiotica]